MNVVFRVDASYTIGGGHLKRCLALADELLNESQNSIFICQNLSGLDISLLQNSKHKFYLISKTSEFTEDAFNTINILDKIPKKKNILIIDNYQIDQNWEKLLIPYVHKLVVIDDLADKKHYCNILINQVQGVHESDYKNYLNNSCNLYLGSKYILLRKEFVKVRARIDSNIYREKITDVHISFGLNDKYGLTVKFSKLILKNFPELNLHIAVGNKFNFINELRDLSSDFKNFHWLKDVNNIEEQMSKCQIAIGSPGMLTWERACLGLPSIQIGTSDNQEPVMQKLEIYKICKWLGLADKINDKYFVSQFKDFLYSPKILEKMHKNCLRIVDGKGLKRVSKLLLSL